MIGIDDIRTRIERRLGATLTPRLIRYVEQAIPRLWGEVKPRDCTS
jgi:hypothetical protein